MVCPLDWGLGHATRMVPVIDNLINKGTRVIIGADNSPLEYLKKRFPGNEFIKLPGFEPRYPKSGSMVFQMIRDFGKMKTSAKKSNYLLQQLIDEKEIDVVISDNRYELYSKKAYSIFITHQLNIQTPGITGLTKPFIQKTIFNYIKKYDELWIPDFENEPSLAGELSHVKKLPINNTHYVGPLSRFSLVKTVHQQNNAELLIILSGPEPQRSILEEKLLNQALKTNFKTIILQAKPGNKKRKIIENVELVSHLNDDEFASLMVSAKYIVCRPGYSTIMDLFVLNQKAAFIPTPGQTEQEYLAKTFKQKQLFYAENQKDANLISLIKDWEKYKGLPRYDNNNRLNARISNLIS